MTVETNSKNVIVYVDVHMKLTSEDDLKAFRMLLDDAEKGFLLRVLAPDNLSKIELDIINELRKSITN
jgi:hypothetical protein